MSHRRNMGEGKGMGGTDKISRSQTMQSGMDASAWKSGYDAMRMKQKMTTGTYNPSTGEREYPIGHRGPMKDMQGRMRGGSPEALAKKLGRGRG